MTRRLCLIAGSTLALAGLPLVVADDHRAPPVKPVATPAHAPDSPVKKSSRKSPAPAKPAPQSQPADDAPDHDEAAPAHDAPDAHAAMTLLREGNQRWLSGNSTNPSIDADRRQDAAENGQHPFVTVLTCADSRIPVERVFDRGVGEVFTVRVAGNVAGVSEVATIEYGLSHLHTPLLVVMGHTHCGAVAAAASNTPVHGMVAKLVSNITPAVDRAKRNNPDADEAAIANLAVTENVWQTVYDLLRESSQVRELATQGKVRIVGAVYDIASGKIEWMGEHPWQTEIMAALEVRSPAPELAAQPEHE